MLQNESKKEVKIPPGTPLGKVQVADLASSPVTGEIPGELDPSQIDFGDSPIPREWRERLTQKLCRRRKVFSLHEWEVGLAQGVEHRIRLSDPDLFVRGPDV